MIVSASENKCGTYDVRIGDFGVWEMSVDAHMPNGVCMRYDGDAFPLYRRQDSLPIGIVQAVANIAYHEGRRIGATGE